MVGQLGGSLWARVLVAHAMGHLLGEAVGLCRPVVCPGVCGGVSSGAWGGRYVGGMADAPRPLGVREGRLGSLVNTSRLNEDSSSSGAPSSACCVGASLDE